MKNEYNHAEYIKDLEVFYEEEKAFNREAKALGATSMEDMGDWLKERMRMWRKKGMEIMMLVFILFSLLGCEKVEYIYVIPDTMTDSLGEVDVLQDTPSDSSETSDTIEVEVGEDVVEEADVEVETAEDVVEDEENEEEGCGDTMSDPFNCGECGHVCPPTWACCAGECRNIMGNDIENCGGCRNRCAGEGCANPGCVDGRCVLFPDDSLCPPGCSCIGTECIQRCVHDFECNDNDRCDGEETCVSSLCEPGIPLDCSDASGRTVDDCYDWDGGVYRPNPCCHICNTDAGDCPVRDPVRETGVYTDPGSFEGVYFLVDSPDVTEGPCSVTHLEFIWEGGQIKMALIEEGWGYLQSPHEFLSLAAFSAGTFQFRYGMLTGVVINGEFSSDSENVLGVIGMFVRTGETTKAGCTLKDGWLGNACKVCGVGADIPSYSGCPY